MSLEDPVMEMLARRIAGEIVLSSSPGATMKKWRALLQVSQVEAAQEMDLSPSVVSDYETGRRHSPGSAFVKRFVGAILDVDKRRGGPYLQQMTRITLDPWDVFLDIREFSTPATIGEICDALKCEVFVGEDAYEQNVFGYTVIDSVKAIQMLSGLEFYRIFGATSERALVFVSVSRGRSPMIAVKISPFRPRIVILHGVRGEVDPLAVGLARHEGIPLAVSKLKTQNDVVDSLLKIYRLTQE